MYYNHRFIQRFEKNCICRHSCRLPDSASWGVVFRLRISPRIRSQNWNGSKRSVMDLCRTVLCKNPRKSASLPCPFKQHRISSGAVSRLAKPYDWKCFVGPKKKTNVQSFLVQHLLHTSKDSLSLSHS